MSALLELDRLGFRRVASAKLDRESARATQHWDGYDAAGTTVAHLEIFERGDSWLVRFFDHLPQTEAADLLRVVARLLVWHANCSVETVEVRFPRRLEPAHTMVRVGGDYV